MADGFQNPQDQAALEAIKAKLTQLDAEFKTAAQQIMAESAALREQRRGAQVTSRSTGSTTRAQDTATAALRVQREVLDAEVLSYERLNQQIERRIALENQAAASVRKAAAATAETRALTPASPAAGPAGLAEQQSWFAAQAARQESMYHRSRPPGGVLTQGEFAGGLQAAGAKAASAAIAAETKALRELAIAEERAAAAAKAERQATVAMGAAMAQARTEVMSAAAAQAEYDTALSRTGGLSGTALKALADGSLTLKDLGNQVGQTIGKFGGWALAGAAVYGALGALMELKKGAVDTSSTVTALGRFLPVGKYNPDAARQSIIDQGRATATPLGEVGNTAQQFAKAFKSQGDVFTATHVSLTAAKLDNISLADSYKYLTAIVQESGAKVSQLPAIFDQITAAQDKVGAKVSTVLPAFAGSVGAVQSSGGDPSQLVGLEALTAIRTGFDGKTIGNMYRQGSSRYFNTAAARGTRERYGINADTGFTQSLIEAIQKSPQLSGISRQDLATGYFGPRFGPRSAPLFRANPDQLKLALGETASGAHPGLANQQLSNAMSQANNQLALLKVNLQAVGAELTGSKATTPFSAMVAGLNEVLQATTSIIHAWDQLPGVVKTAGADIGAVVATLAIARRFNLGGILATSDSRAVRAAAPIFQRNPQKVLETNVGKAMEQLQQTIVSGQQSAAVAQSRAAHRLAQAQSEMAALDEAGLRDTEEYNIATQRAAAARAAVGDAKSDLAYYAAAGSERSLAEHRAAMLGTGGGTAGGSPIIPLTGAGRAASGGAITQRLQSGADVAQARAAAAALAGDLSLAGAASVTFRTGIARASSMLSTLADNAIPAALAAFAAFAVIKTSVDRGNAADAQARKKIDHAPTIQQATDALHKRLGLYGAGSITIPLVGIKVPNAIGRDVQFFTGQDDAIKARWGRRVAQLENQGVRAEYQGTDLQNQYFNAEGMYGRTAPAGGSKGRIAALERALNQLSKDKALYQSEPNTWQNLHSTLQNAIGTTAATGKSGVGSNPFAQWEHASQDLTNQLEPMMQAITNASKVFGTTKGNLNSLAQGYLYAVERFGKNAGDTKAMQALAQAQQDLVTATDKQVQDLMNLAAMATTNSGQRADYQGALGAVHQTIGQIQRAAGAARKLPGADIAGIDAAERQAVGLVAQKRKAALEGLLGLMQSQTDVSVSNVGGIGPAADLQRAQATLTGLQGQLSTAKGAGADAQIVNSLMAKVNQQAVTVLQNRVSYLQQLSQAETQYQQGATADPVAQQGIAIANLQQLYQNLVSAGSKDQTQLLGILGQERAAVLQKIADQISLQQTKQQAALSQMNIGAPQQVQLGNAVSAAQQELAYVQSLPSSQVNPQTLVQAQNALYQAQGALAQFQIQQGQQMIQAESQLRQGNTFDPVKIAGYALEGARRLLAYDQAHNMPAAQITQDQAQVAQDYKARTEARWQKQESTIQFLAATYQITGQQEITRLQKLLTAMRKAHASYQSIQQVAQELFNLEYNASGQLNLNTGNLHLPSTYEVRSAIRSGNLAHKRKTSAGLLADVKTDVRLTVYVNKDADIRKFTDALGHALGTSVDGLAQAAGLV